MIFLHNYKSLLSARSERWGSWGGSGDTKGGALWEELQRQTLNFLASEEQQKPDLHLWLINDLAHWAHVFYVCAGVWTGVGGWDGARERERRKEQSLCPQGLSWACAGSYKKPGKIKSNYYCGRKNWYRHRHRTSHNSDHEDIISVTFACLFSQVAKQLSHFFSTHIGSSSKSRRLCKHKSPIFLFFPWPLYSLPDQLCFTFFKFWEWGNR